MARVQFKSLAAGVAVDNEGRGSSVSFETDVPLYAGATGATLEPGRQTDSRGRTPGWVDPDEDAGTYTISYSDGDPLTFALGNTTLATNAARKPGSAADAFSVQFQFVAEKDGNDANDGLSWGSAKKEIQAALAALPNGGIVFVAPGSYRPLVTLVFNGHRVFAVAGVNGGVAVNAKTTIQHNFNGDLIDIQRGGGLNGFVLTQMGNFTGAAIKATSTTAARTGLLFLDNIVTASNDGINGFERNLVLDGSADATVGGPGLRSVFGTNLQFFGAKIAGENVLLNRVIHAFFNNFEIIQAPETAVQQGLKILHAESEEIYVNGAYILGDFNSAGEDPMRIIVNGTITGANNGPERWRPVSVFGGTWANAGGGWPVAAYRKTSQGRVELRGRIAGGVIGTTAFTLPAGFLPPGAVSRPVESNLAFGVVQITMAGAVIPVVGNTAYVSLDSIGFQA